MNVFLQVWPGRVVFPDFTNEAKTLPWFKSSVNYFRDVEGIKVDGLWVVSALETDIQVKYIYMKIKVLKIL